ncbi:MAG TPA: trehalose-phosphatase [Terriglobales bacterium]|nr:trehalose-phosphatase [Terriglobales bacterium]
MQILHPEFDLESFYRKLRRAPRRLLMLDYDGTLAPFRAQRDQAIPYPGVREALDDLLALDRDRVVIISGRAVADVLPLLGLRHSVELWGSHGIERRRPKGGVYTAAMDPAALRGLAEADSWVASAGLEPHAESKPGCLAIHWRGLSPADARALRTRVREHWLQLAEKYGLDLRDFDGGLELRVPWRSKADAVRVLLNEEGDTAPAAYLGDDHTDEDAFAALEGRGLRILVRPELRPTAADVWLKPPQELLDFLHRWREGVP